MSDLIFFKDNGTAVLDPKAYVANWLQNNLNSELHIGCDSKVKGSQVKYSVSICMRQIGAGVHEIYSSKILPKQNDTYHRLWTEVNMVVELAEKLADLAEINVHLDLNRDPKFLSHRLLESSVGYIKSLGYNAIAKPDAWAASSSAHSRCQ